MVRTRQYPRTFWPEIELLGVCALGRMWMAQDIKTPQVVSERDVKMVGPDEAEADNSNDGRFDMD